MSALRGFADPVLDAQASFRAVLEAMARPGRVLPVARPPEPPSPLCPAAAAVVLTLVDAETPLWTDAGPEAEGWARFHCGCPVVASAGEAAFVLALGTPPELAALRAGTEEEPESGATLILQVTSLEAGRGLRLSGPGIEREHRLLVGGLPPGFVAAWGANRARFPRGIDVILCAGDRVAALPRTVRIEEG
jgi:alpha-D-ribose 1-methylphosphonate 5-triphosphate synthase subunit PhnH